MQQEHQSADVILVVDDENYARLLTKTILERAGFEVITASDGQEAIDTFHGNDDTIGLMVLDLRLPIKTGAQVYDELRAEYPELPINLYLILSPGPIFANCDSDTAISRKTLEQSSKTISSELITTVLPSVSGCLHTSESKGEIIENDSAFFNLSLSVSICSSIPIKRLPVSSITVFVNAISITIWSMRCFE